MLCAEAPLIPRREIYATAAIAGATVFVLISMLGADGLLATFPSVATVFLLRLTAIKLDLQLPSFGATNGEE